MRAAGLNLGISTVWKKTHLVQPRGKSYTIYGKKSANKNNTINKMDDVPVLLKNNTVYSLYFLAYDAISCKIVDLEIYKEFYKVW